MCKIQIYILCRNRLNYFKECLNSVLNQNFKDYEVVVSDNSDDNKIKSFLESNHNDLKYIKRNSSITALEHYKLLIDEASKEYVVFFHDDDLMKNDYLSEIYNYIEGNSGLVAVGSNAFYINKNLKLKKTFSNIKKNKLINDPHSLIKSYMGIKVIKHPPFSSYIYKTSLIKNIYISQNEGGKYSDLFFLSKLIEKGKILWISKPLIFYRLHETNDSSSESILDRINLINNICNKYKFHRRDSYIRQYKFKYLLSFYKKRRLKYFKRRRVILKFLILSFINFLIFNNLFRNNLLKNLLSKII